MRKVQWEGELEEGGEEGERAVEERRRREWVKKAFLHAWEGYK
jgi:mannosyl-oligosaccharide alpha-1,2-mannosidase